MTDSERVKDIVRCFHANWTPGTRLGALRIAMREHLLPETLRQLGIKDASGLLDALHKEREDG